MNPAEVFLTVLTPTYNRAYTLPALYKSLCAQTKCNFEWLIIDDGSTDDTQTVVKSLLGKAPFQIKYYQKQNGGKHTALNFSHPYIKGKMLAIVDSDDILLPQAAAVIEQDWQLYKDNPFIGGISYLKQYPDGRFMSKRPPKDFYLSDYVHYRMNRQIGGDQFEVIRTAVFLQYQFPQFPNERFLSEICLWAWMGCLYQMVYRNKALYQGAYLPDGLTRAGARLQLENQLGTLQSYKAYFVPGVNIHLQFYFMRTFWRFGMKIKMPLREIARRSGRPFWMWLIFPVALFVYWYRADYKEIK